MNHYFEGRYYKHQKGDQTLCLIAGQADGGPFIQVITNTHVWQYDSLAGCQIDTKGIRLDLPQIKGAVRYGPYTPLKGDIMGPFQYLPMQCRHEVVSMGHTLEGGFLVDGRMLDLSGGRGYIEGDRGRSFPNAYLWLHCNDFSQPLSIMASVADIPFVGFHFMGCICAIHYKGREIRLATYRGVHIHHAGRDGLTLAQGRYRLRVDIGAHAALPLKAPRKGQMVDTIHESNCASARFRLWESGALLFDLASCNTSFECTL